MEKEREEYVSLRQEIVDLCSAADRIIHILYIFLAPYLCFAFAREDTIYILFSNIVIIPLYLLSIDRRIATCKISAYISVFHEEGKNKWESRLIKYKNSKEPIIFKYFSSKHFPFIFANYVNLLVFVYQTKWSNLISIYEIAKIIIEVIFFFLITFIFLSYKKIQVSDYVGEWEKIKDDEDRESKESKEKYINFINNMSEEEKSTIFKIIIQQAKEEHKNTGKNPFKLK